MSNVIMSATGPIDAADLGFTHSHEHVLWDYWDLIASYDTILDDEQVAIDELIRFRDAGGSSMVECSTVGIRTDPLALRRVSQAAGVNLVLGCGWYRERLYPPIVHERTAAELGELLVHELTVGIEETDVQAGLIGEIGTERRFISAAEERVFRAAARAHAATGVAILTHTTHFGELALEQLALLEDAGVRAARVIISHLGDRRDPTLLLEVAKRGAYLSIDNVGYAGDGYPGDDIRAANVVTLIRHGFGDQVVLGTDISTKSALAGFGGRGYDWLLRAFVPRLLDAGLTEDELRALTVTNIARALTPGV